MSGFSEPTSLTCQMLLERCNTRRT